MGIVLIYSTKTDTQLTDLCFLKLGMLVPLRDFQQSCTHKPCWVYVGRGQHLLAKTTRDVVIKRYPTGNWTLASYTMCHLVTSYAIMNWTQLLLIRHIRTMKNMEINLGINSRMSTTILARVHYHTAEHEWKWMASINQHTLQVSWRCVSWFITLWDRTITWIW